VAIVNTACYKKDCQCVSEESKAGGTRKPAWVCGVQFVRHSTSPSKTQHSASLGRAGKFSERWKDVQKSGGPRTSGTGRRMSLLLRE
jgi:hypothetical protein